MPWTPGATFRPPFAPMSRWRPGAALGNLSDSQRVLLHNLLRAFTSSQGYHKMALAMHADQVLNDIENGNPLFGSATLRERVRQS